MNKKKVKNSVQKLCVCALPAMLGVLVLGPQSARAQSLQNRLEYYRERTPSVQTGPIRSLRAKAKKSPSILGRTQWVAVAQIVPAPAPEQPAPQLAAKPQSVAERMRKQVTTYAEVQYGYDKQQILVTTPTPFIADVRRQIRNLVVTAQYPLSSRTNLALSIPYISQTTRGSTPGGSFRQKGNGLGDVGVFVEHRFPEVARGTEISVTAGMLFPTGTDPYNLKSDQLPTGLGFYQPLVRVRASKMRVPLQFYGAVDYGTSLSRNVNGERMKLPDSYGGEVGFYYALSPEFTTQTAVKWSKISSPFKFQPDSNVAYLSQALLFNSGSSTSFQAAVDAGLTDDALDLFLSLALVKRF